jgi:hypothetical protein
MIAVKHAKVCPLLMLATVPQYGSFLTNRQYWHDKIIKAKSLTTVIAAVNFLCCQKLTTV